MDESSKEKPALDLKARGISSTKARLFYLDDSRKEHQEMISSPSFSIGRGRENDLNFPRKVGVSHKHAIIQMRDAEYILKDLNSTQGTYVNGEKVAEHTLRPGDHIQLGVREGQVLTFHQGDLLESLAGYRSLPGESLAVRDFRELGLLIATLLKLSSISVLDDLMILATDTAIEITGAERGFIILKDNEGNLRFRCARDAQKRLLDVSFIDASRGIPEEVIRTGLRKVITGLGNIPHGDAISFAHVSGLRSIACVPLHYVSPREGLSSSGEKSVNVIGVLYLDGHAAGVSWSETQLDVLETLATEIATAVYNARLYREFREKQKLEQELNLAHQIQQALLPPPHKILPYAHAHSLNLPCRQVGGDYFDYFDLENGRLGFAVGDVSGKGVPAALMAARIQGIFCAQVMHGLTLQDTFANVNRNLTERQIEGAYITFFFGILDSEGSCTYTNAGHNRPIVIRRDGSCYELSEGGTVLGLFPAAEYRSETVRLQPGDHVVLFTDGLLDAQNSRGESFGEERLHSLLRQCARCRAAEILARLQEELASFSAGVPQQDDITLMVLSYQESTP